MIYLDCVPRHMENRTVVLVVRFYGGLLIIEIPPP